MVAPHPLRLFSVCTCVTLLAMVTPAVGPAVGGSYGEIVTPCTIIDTCVIDCSHKGFGPSVPEPSEVVPSACQGKYLDEYLLDGNAIKTIPTEWLGGWRVHTLNLVGNSLSEIKPGGFSGTKCTLERIFLAENTLLGYNGLTKDMFSGVECSLKRLNLDGCQLTSNDLYALKDLAYLDQLHLNRNSITDLPLGVFSKMKNLNKLYLKENGIFIPHYEQPFNGLNSLSVLDLASNRLETVGYCSVGKLPVLNYLKLENNHLVCNCSLWWLRSTPWSGGSVVADCLETLSGCPDPKQVGCSGRPAGGDEEVGGKGDKKTRPTESSGLSSAELAAVLSVVSLVTVASLVAVVVVIVVCHRRRRSNNNTTTTGTASKPADRSRDATQRKVAMPSVVADNQMRRLPTAPPRGDNTRVLSEVSSNEYELPMDQVAQPGKSVGPGSENSYSRLVSVPGHSGDGGDGYMKMDGAGLVAPQKY